MKRQLLQAFTGILEIQYYTEEFALNYGMATTKTFEGTKKKLREEMYQKYVADFERLSNMDSQIKSLESQNILLGS
ncbi:hypothetical protein GH714_012491 [Hevea brasiliensis]|uniref:Uncharacterized protein n=1 Tax=Hevea brasiliensis TaxID=3981 RepID=A0A6A6M0Q6_HEVBR|nr:hypothetical protein GH714_012491 [Hevea brasiliensis]